MSGRDPSIAEQELAELARALPRHHPSNEASQRMRRALLEMVPERRQPDIQPRRRWPIAVAAAASLLLAVSASLAVRWTATEPYRGVVTGPESARFSHSMRQARASDAQDEIVRVTQGHLRVDVEHLAANESFHVVTADAEVTVRGTSFEVTVEADHLEQVWVRSGMVEVRKFGSAPVLLGT